MIITHKVIDLVYTPEEGQDCFIGTEKECYEFIEKQGGEAFTYKVVPLMLDEVKNANDPEDDNNERQKKHDLFLYETLEENGDPKEL